MDVRAVYKHLENEVTKNPDKYILTTAVCNNINQLLPDNGGNFLLGLIYEHHSLSLKSKKLSELDFVTRMNRKHNVLLLPYKGKTYDTGKGPKYEDMEKLPLKLQKIIVAYISYIT